MHVGSLMTDITLTIADDVLEKARAVAEKRGTTLNAILGDYLTQLATEEQRWARSRERLSELMDHSTADIGPDFQWNRDELYD